MAAVRIQKTWVAYLYLKSRTKAAVVIASMGRRYIARNRYGALVEEGYRIWEQWKDATALIENAKNELLGQQEDNTSSIFSWSKLKSTIFDISTQDDQDGDEDGDMESTRVKMGAATMGAATATDDAHDAESDSLPEVSVSSTPLDSRELPTPAVSPGAHKPRQDAYDNIMLTQAVLKWYKRADPKYKDFFLRRMRQLANGDKSRILKKNLTGSKHTIWETYLDQASAQRIICRWH